MAGKVCSVARAASVEQPRNHCIARWGRVQDGEQMAL